MWYSLLTVDTDYNRTMSDNLTFEVIAALKQLDSSVQYNSSLFVKLIQVEEFCVYFTLRTL